MRITLRGARPSASAASCLHAFQGRALRAAAARTASTAQVATPAQFGLAWPTTVPAGTGQLDCLPAIHTPVTPIPVTQIPVNQQLNDDNFMGQSVAEPAYAGAVRADSVSTKQVLGAEARGIPPRGRPV